MYTCGQDQRHRPCIKSDNTLPAKPQWIIKNNAREFPNQNVWETGASVLSKIMHGGGLFDVAVLPERQNVIFIVDNKIS